MWLDCVWVPAFHQHAESVQPSKAVNVFFPNQKDRGTHINISGIGVAKFAPNKDNAIKFIEYLISKEVQEKFASANYEYPVNADASSSELLNSCFVKGWDALVPSHPSFMGWDRATPFVVYKIKRVGGGWAQGEPM